MATKRKTRTERSTERMITNALGKMKQGDNTGIGENPLLVSVILVLAVVAYFIATRKADKARALIGA